MPLTLPFQHTIPGGLTICPFLIGSLRHGPIGNRNMKSCPTCNSSWPDTDQFCERDGTALITNNSDTSRKALVVLAVVVAAMSLGLLLVACQSSKETTANSSSPSSSNQPLAQQVVSPPPPLLPSPSATATPSPSPSPSPTPTPKPPVKTETARVALSTGPIAATADAGKRGPVTIRLTDGTTIKADEAWETAEGIWYRRRGLVTLLKRDQVRALETPKPTPSPTPSPVPSP